MSVKAGAGLSTLHDPLEAGRDAAGAAARALGSAEPDLAVVFASGSHLVAPEALLEGVHSALAPRALVGCGAGGVLGESRELESGTAVAVWAADFGGTGEASVFHATVQSDGTDAWLDGLPQLDGSSGAILLVRSVFVPRGSRPDRTGAAVSHRAGARWPPQREVRRRARAHCSATGTFVNRERSASVCAGSRCSRACPRARPRSAAR